MSDQRYMMRGVSASKEDVHNAIKNIDKGLYPKAFCKIIPDILGGDPEFCNIMHADGAGTKSSLAYLYWNETGDLGVWKGIAQDALIMNIDDLLCVGATDNILVSSTIGRNKLLIPGEVISAIINGTDELLAELREMGVGVYATGGETATHADSVDAISQSRHHNTAAPGNLVAHPLGNTKPIGGRMTGAHHGNHRISVKIRQTSLVIQHRRRIGNIFKTTGIGGIVIGTDMNPLFHTLGKDFL